MSGLSERDLARIGVADEILLAPDRGDRSRGPAVPIWVVRVGDELYVRSYRGASGGWYRRARFSRNGRIRSRGNEFRVRFSGVAAPGKSMRSTASSTAATAVLCHTDDFRLRC